MFKQTGLFDPYIGHDACGVGFIAKMDAQPSHDLVLQAVQALGNMVAHQGGLTTKIHAVVDALGHPLRILLTPGNVNDIVPAATLIKGLSADKLLADRAFDANKLIESAHKQKMEAVFLQLHNA